MYWKCLTKGNIFMKYKLDFANCTVFHGFQFRQRMLSKTLSSRKIFYWVSFITIISISVILICMIDLIVLFLNYFKSCYEEQQSQKIVSVLRSAVFCLKLILLSSVIDSTIYLHIQNSIIYQRLIRVVQASYKNVHLIHQIS